MSSITDILATVDKLEPFPETAAKLAQIVSDEKSTIDDVVNIIKYDQAISTEILRIANSVFSASKREITSVREGVIRLGSGRILEILVSRSVRSVMCQPLKQYGYLEKELWFHSIASAIAAEYLNSYAKTSIGGISFTAALLHDLGKLLIVNKFSDKDVFKILKLLRNEDIAWAAAEKKVFGFSHADIGAEIADMWGLPDVIIRAILNHHNDDYGFDPIIDCVRVSNVVARVIGYGVGFEGMGVCIDSNIAERLKISREQFEQICAETAQKFMEVIAMYDMENNNSTKK
ncbi:MAG: HDOD domain-containing protein [Chitinispirillia bacterium]|jgi:putative nucleotidyltransferase with HDIG domain